MSPEELQQIRERNTRDLLTLPHLKELAKSIDDQELREAIHMVEDRDALLRALDECRQSRPP